MRHAACLLLLATALAGADTSLRNGGFENAPGTWPWRPERQGADAACALVDEGAAEGRTCARLRLGGAGGAAWRQSIIQLQPGSALRLACQVRTAGLASGAVAGAELAFLTADGRPAGTPLRLAVPTAATAWTPLAGATRVPDGAVAATLALRLAGGAGTAWFDAVTLDKEGAAPGDQEGATPGDPLQLSTMLPGQRLLRFAEFTGLAPGTPAGALAGWLVEGAPRAQVSDAHPFTAHINDRVLEIAGGSPGSLVLPFAPLAAGRLRIAFGLARTRGDGPLDLRLFLRDSQGRRSPLIAWDALSFARADRPEVAVPGGRLAAKPTVERHSSIYPEPWLEQHQHWLFTLVAERGADGAPGRFLVDTHVGAALADFRQRETVFPLDAGLADFAALEYEVGAGPGRLYLSNLLVDGPVWDSAALDAEIGRRRADLAPARTVGTPDDLPADAEHFRRRVIYQTSPAIHTPDGRLASYHRLIPHFKAIGVDVLYFTCLWKSTRYAPGGMNGFPEYDGFALSPQLGSEEDFRTLVQALHANGIEVMVDVGLHSASWDSPLVRERPEWFLKLPGGPFNSWPTGESQPYVYLCRYDLTLQAVQDHLIALGRHWLRTYGIDALRVDLASSLFLARDDAAGRAVMLNFWRAFKRAMREENPGFHMLGECANPGMLSNGFDLQYTAAWHFRIRVLKEWIARQGRPAGAIVHALRRMLPGEYPDERLFLLNLDNHDFGHISGGDGGGAASPLVQGFGSLARANLYMALTAVLPGVPMIFGGQEVDNRLFNSGIAGHGRADAATLAFYQRLFRLRRALRLDEGALPDLIDLTPGGVEPGPAYRPYAVDANRALAERHLDACAYPDWLAFARRTSAGSVVVLANHGDAPADLVPDLARQADLADARAVRLIRLTAGGEEACDRPLAGAWRLAPWEVVLVALADGGR